MEQSSFRNSFYSKIRQGLNIAKEGIASANRFSDLCIVKIRTILQKVNFNDVKNVVDKYKWTQVSKAQGLCGEEKIKAENKISAIDAVIDYINVLEDFATGGELEAPTDAVLDIITEIAQDKNNSTLVIIVQVLQIIIKTVKGIQSLQHDSENSIEVCSASEVAPKVTSGANPIQQSIEDSKLSEALNALHSMIDMAVQDGVVTPEEKTILLAQAAEAGVEAAELDNMIAEALQ